MAYTTIDKVNEFLTKDNEVDDQTYPTIAVAASWLPQLDASINVAYALGGNVLADASADVITWFGLLVAKEAAYLVMQVRGALKDNASLWQGYHDEWLAAIAKISDKEQAAAIVTPSSPLTGAPSTFSDPCDPWFEKERFEY